MTSVLTPINEEMVSHQVPKGSAADHVNVGDTERWLSVAGGGALALGGIERRDLAGLTMAAVGTCLLYRGLSGHCPVYGALEIRPTKHSRVAAVAAGHGIKVNVVMAISRPVEDLYRHWRNFENLPAFMSHLVSVKTEGNRSHWVAKGPAGTKIEWDADLVTEEPNQLIGWRSLEGSQVATAGSVHFRPLPHDRGTEVRIVLKYDPPGGTLGSWLAWAFGEEPTVQIREELRAFKQTMEAGETAVATGPATDSRRS